MVMSNWCIFWNAFMCSFKSKFCLKYNQQLSSFLEKQNYTISTSKRKYRRNNKILPNAKDKIKLHERIYYVYTIYTWDIYILYIYEYKTNQAQAYNKKKFLLGNSLIKT